MENSTLIFEIALGLSSPWYVKNVSFEANNLKRELHIHLDFKKGFKFKQEDESELVAYDTVERKWQHLQFFEHKCYIHARVPRVKDKSGKVQVQQVLVCRFKYLGHQSKKYFGHINPKTEQVSNTADDVEVNQIIHF